MVKTSKKMVLNIIDHKKEHDLHTQLGSKFIRKLLLRTVLFLPRQIKLQNLYDKYNLGFVLKKHLNHYNKLYYPYLIKGLPVHSKLQYLEEHFITISKFDKKVIYSLYNNSIELIDLSPYNLNLLLKMKYDHSFRIEGEITFYLEDKDSSETLYTITGIFIKNAFIIGGVQGKTTKETIQLLTKKCFGMRPQNFLLLCVMEFSKDMDCSYIYGVKGEYHTYEAIKRLKNRIKFDYNTFWSELGSAEELNQWFAFPSSNPLKNILEIQSSKRSMYRKRYTLLENISVDIKNKIEVLASINE